MSERAGRSAVASAAFRVLLANEGSVVHVDQMARETNFTPKQLSSAVYNLCRRDGRLEGAITQVIPGIAWRYQPEPSASKPAEQPAQPAARPAVHADVAPRGTKRVYRSAKATPTFTVVHVDRKAGTRLLEAPDGELWVARKLGTLDQWAPLAGGNG